MTNIFSRKVLQARARGVVKREELSKVNIENIPNIFSKIQIIIISAGYKKMQAGACVNNFRRLRGDAQFSSDAPQLLRSKRATSKVDFEHTFLTYSHFFPAG
jgi:hypothetical protein